jgi:hypothetical protein
MPHYARSRLTSDKRCETREYLKQVVRSGESESIFPGGINGVKTDDLWNSGVRHLVIETGLGHIYCSLHQDRRGEIFFVIDKIWIRLMGSTLTFVGIENRSSVRIDTLRAGANLVPEFASFAIFDIKVDARSDHPLVDTESAHRLNRS